MVKKEVGDAAAVRSAGSRRQTRAGNRAKTTVVRGTVTLEQEQVIHTLIGVLGSNEQDVVSKILTLWLYNEGFLKNKSDVKGGSAHGKRG